MSDGAALLEAEGPAPFIQRTIGRAHAALAAVLVAERDRWALWFPVLFAAGIGVYFGLFHEPPRWFAPVLGVTAIGAAIVASRRPVLLLFLISVGGASAGMTLAQWRAVEVAAPVLAKRWGPAELEGRVVSVETRAEGRRVVLDRVVMPGLEPRLTPATVRLRVRNEASLHPGDRIAVRAVLMPPPAPAAPGAYDFQRQAWFERLGAVGYSLGEFRVVEIASGTLGFRLWLNGLRQDIVERVLAVVPSPAGAIVAALLTGEQGSVPPEAMEWMRDSGLAHLLSVSGLHVGLVAAIVFLIVRRSLALIPPVALRWPIKKWGAVAAFVAVTLYMLFVAPAVPIQRAWLMTSIVLFAILVDRTAISMRLVAWAAFAVLLIAPESLLNPSFQMSFASVVALIAAWEASRERIAAWRAQAGWLRRAAIWLAGVSLTTLVASLATAPYALYHFNRFTAFALAANLLAVPLTGLWVMPWAVATFALLPFGLERWALVPMGWGADGILAIAREVASWEGAVALWPAMPVWGLVVATLGGLWLCLWRTRWRLAGLPFIALGVLSMTMEREPDILVAGDARLFAVRGSDGTLQLSTMRAGRIARETWLRRAGQSKQPALWPRSGRSADGALACDPAGCLYTARERVVAFVQHASALAEDCRNADVVIASIPVRRRCPSADLVIDRFTLWRDGGHAIWLTADGARVESVRAARGARPWVPPLPTSGNRRDADRTKDRDLEPAN